MKKKELIEVVAEKTGLSKRDVSVVVDQTLATIVETLKADGQVQLLGFGTFLSVHRPARIMPRPGRSGETMEVGPKTSAKFKASKALKNLKDN